MITNMRLGSGRNRHQLTCYELYHSPHFWVSSCLSPWVVFRVPCHVLPHVLNHCEPTSSTRIQRRGDRRRKKRTFTAAGPRHGPVPRTWPQVCLHTPSMRWKRENRHVAPMAISDHAAQAKDANPTEDASDRCHSGSGTREWCDAVSAPLYRSVVSLDGGTCGRLSWRRSLRLV